jgi:hypothetical protein
MPYISGISGGPAAQAILGSKSLGLERKRLNQTRRFGYGQQALAGVGAATDLVGIGASMMLGNRRAGLDQQQLGISQGMLDLEKEKAAAEMQLAPKKLLQEEARTKAITASSEADVLSAKAQGARAIRDIATGGLDWLKYKGAQSLEEKRLTQDRELAGTKQTGQEKLLGMQLEAERENRIATAADRLTEKGMDREAAWMEAREKEAWQDRFLKASQGGDFDLAKFREGEESRRQERQIESAMTLAEKNQEHELLLVGVKDENATKLARLNSELDSDAELNLLAKQQEGQLQQLEQEHYNNLVRTGKSHEYAIKIAEIQGKISLGSQMALQGSEQKFLRWKTRFEGALARDLSKEELAVKREGMAADLAADRRDEAQKDRAQNLNALTASRTAVLEPLTTNPNVPMETRQAAMDELSGRSGIGAMGPGAQGPMPRGPQDEYLAAQQLLGGLVPDAAKGNTLEGMLQTQDPFEAAQRAAALYGPAAQSNPELAGTSAQIIRSTMQQQGARFPTEREFQERLTAPRMGSWWSGIQREQAPKEMLDAAMMTPEGQAAIRKLLAEMGAGQQGSPLQDPVIQSIMRAGGSQVVPSTPPPPRPPMPPPAGPLGPDELMRLRMRGQYRGR